MGYQDQGLGYLTHGMGFRSAPVVAPRQLPESGELPARGPGDGGLAPSQPVMPTPESRAMRTGTAEHVTHCGGAAGAAGRVSEAAAVDTVAVASAAAAVRTVSTAQHAAQRGAAAISRNPMGAGPPPATGSASRGQRTPDGGAAAPDAVPGAASAVSAAAAHHAMRQVAAAPSIVPEASLGVIAGSSAVSVQAVVSVVPSAAPRAGPGTAAAAAWEAMREELTCPVTQVLCLLNCRWTIPAFGVAFTIVE